MNADRSDHARNTLLQERDSGITAVRPVAGQKDQEYGRGADQKRVDVDGNDLRKTLLGGVGDCRGCACIRRGTHTGLVGEETSLDAEHHTGTGKAAEDRFEVKCILHDDREDTGYFCNISDDHKDTDSNVESCHGRNQY